MEPGPAWGRGAELRAREAFLLSFIEADGSIRMTREDPMRQVWLGLVGVMAAGAAWAESYSFPAVIQRAFQEQTTIQCEGAKLSGRVPTGCILSERAIAYPNIDNRTAYPNLTNPKGLHSTGVACAAGHPIVFH